MMPLIAAYARPIPVRPRTKMIDAAKIEAHWLLIEGKNQRIDPRCYSIVRAVLVAQWQAARAGTLKPEHFYTATRNIAGALVTLIQIRRARAVRS